MGNLWEMVIILLMEMEDHQEGGANLQEEEVDLQAKVDPQVEVDPQVAKYFQEEVEADFRLEV
jgi:hypothetical protein